MKRNLTMLLTVVILLSVALPLARATRPLLDQRFKKILHDPNHAKAGGLPALLESVVGKRRAKTMLESLNPSLSASPNPTFGPNAWVSGWPIEVYGQTIYPMLDDAVTVIRAHRAQYGAYPTPLYFYNYGLPARMSWNAKGYYEISYYTNATWQSFTTFTP